MQSLQKPPCVGCLRPNSLTGICDDCYRILPIGMRWRIIDLHVKGYTHSPTYQKLSLRARSIIAASTRSKP